MKASDLKFEEIFSFEEGNLNFHGRRLEVHPIHVLGQFYKDILGMLGKAHARRVFTRFGYFWGQADAAVLSRIFNWDETPELILAAFRMLAINGSGKPIIKVLGLDEESERVSVECTWEGASTVEAYLAEFGPAEEPICWRLVGYLSGFLSQCLGKEVYFIENTCQAKGDSYCHAVGKDLDSWGDEIKPHLEFFEQEDIKGFVARLSGELQEKKLELEEKQRLLGIGDPDTAPHFIEGRSKVLLAAIDIVRRVAQFDTSVLITGETGVGKEVMARFLHGISPRSSGPFVAINCGTLPETLLESELFGHKAGAFTGAVKDRTGLFEQADRGTIFLDEIGDISPAMQLKILRVLQEKEIMRIGESVIHNVDVRIVAATNKDLEQEVAQGKFRDDLLYRLRVVEVNVPPLRERKEDILPLALSMIKRLAAKLGLSRLQLDAKCIDYLQAYSWPGNVRELENALERAAVFNQDGLILPAGLPAGILRAAAVGKSHHDPLSRNLKEVEREHIAAVLHSTGGNRAQAARILGICTATLWRKLKQMEQPASS